MRILVVTSTFPRWQEDTEPAFVYDLCKFLQRNGIQVDVLSPHTYGARKYEVMEGISVFRYRYFFSKFQSLAYSGGIMANIKMNPVRYFQIPFFSLFQLIALANRIRKTNYDLIHAHWIIPQGIISVMVNKIFFANKKKIICTSHGGDLYALDNYIFRRLKAWTINNCSDLCVVSNTMKQKATSLGIPGNAVHVMPMGVDLYTLFKPVQGIKRIEHRIIFVGRLVEKKGVDILIQAYAEVIREYPDSNLLIVGDGPMRPELEAIVKRFKLESNITFLGSVKHKDLPELFSSASISVVPSIIAASGDQEGLGLVTLEALGCGCAVIASSLEAIKEVIDEETGILVNPGDVNDLALGINDLLNNPQKRLQMAAKGQEMARQRYSWEISGDRYMKLMLGYNRTDPSVQ